MKKGKKSKKAAPKVITNTKFSQENEHFLKAVEATVAAGYIDIQATTRQASKFLNKKGTVYLHSQGLIGDKK